ncbi:MAG TPA: CPBP family glutamic-type intramembrane protease [Pyrinomonadaceae bacterium]|jgi:membrane protease YdiL (CAAX protease family)
MTENKEQTIDLISAKALALAEIFSIVVSCLIAEWVFLSFFSRHRWLVIVPLILAVIFMILSHRAYNESTQMIGFRVDNFLSAVRLLLWPTLLAVIVILVVGWFLAGPPVLSRLLRPRLLLLPGWALLQQYALQGYINRRTQVAFGKGAVSICVVAVVFALLHLPNPVLTFITFIAALVWAAIYQREANLFALAASHTVASISLALALPLNVINGLRVGFKYFG